MNMTFTSHDVSLVRHIVQHILVPCVFVIGLAGNSVSIYVLTRKRMRCTTNIYLTALAITDLIYLIMALLLSFQHYTTIHRCCRFYWLTFGIIHWLCDACAYISIYTAVCFTVERFIAIRYPLKRQSFCTETLAKNVIAGVTVFCLVTTMCTAFEHDFITTFQLMTPSGESCNQSAFIVQFNQDIPLSYMEVPVKLQHKNTSIKRNEVTDDDNRSEVVATTFPTYLKNNDGEQLMNLKKDQFQQQLNPNIPTGSSTVPAIVTPKFHSITNVLPKNCSTEYLKEDKNAFANKTGFYTENIQKVSNSISACNLNIGTNLYDSAAKNYAKNGGEPIASAVSNIESINLTETTLSNCVNITYFEHIASALGKNDMYIKIWYFFTLFVFVLIPLCMLITFNSFLILIVRKSMVIRGKMINSPSVRGTRKLMNTSISVSQENRITVTLIAVVLLFIICQLPWAIYLIVSEHIDIDDNTRKIIGNIFNFLCALNGAANFFLYCVLSDKYRRMVRELITGHRYRHHRSTFNSKSTSIYLSDRRSVYRASNASTIIKNTQQNSVSAEA